MIIMTKVIHDGLHQIRRWSGIWEDGAGNFSPSSAFWPEEGNDDSLQVMMVVIVVMNHDALRCS